MAPNLNDFSVLRSKVNKYMQDLGLESAQAAFAYVALETILGLNADDIEDAITDGSSDGGIDALYCSNDTVHIFNFKYTEEFDNTKRNFPQEDIDKLVSTMPLIYEKELKQKDVNEALWDKVREVWDLFAQVVPKFRYYICSNKLIPTTQAREKLEKSLKKYGAVEFTYIDLEGMVFRVIERKYPAVDGTITFVDKQYFDRSDGPLKGIVATVSATDLINLVKVAAGDDKINEDVFNQNVRVYMPNSRINSGIIETALSQENYQFWYLNNGITIVCDECTYLPNMRSPKVDLKNFQIVNGGQTTHALFEAYQRDRERIDNILLLVRICETKKADAIAEKISETTNSQTPVRSRDLRANDPIQKRLEDEFRSMGYYYERKKNQFSEKAKHLRLDSELLGQLYMAYYLDMPSEARNQKGLVFGDKYDNIFDERQITASKMIVPFNLYLPLEMSKKVIQAKKRKKELVGEADAFLSRGVFHILNAAKYVAEHDSLDLLQNKDASIAIAKATALVGEVVTREMKSRGDVYTHDKFFKETPTNDIVRKYIVASL